MVSFDRFIFTLTRQVRSKLTLPTLTSGKLNKYFIIFFYVFLQKRLPDLFELLT